MGEEVEVKIKLSESEIEPLRERLSAQGFRPLSAPIQERNLLFDFAEIEGSRKEILETASRLGWSASRFLTSSYIDLYRERET